MKTATTLLLAVTISLLTTCCRADGLIYRLPADGASIEFELNGSFERQGQTMAIEGTLAVSSVGKKAVDGEPCRWIEFKMTVQRNGQDRTVIAKVLVPEKELAAGKTPLGHVKETWLKQGDREARRVDDLSGNDGGPLPAFLAGPFSDAKKLESTKIESGLGPLNCAGVSGSTSFRQGNSDHKWTFSTRLNDKAPFGLVTTEIKVEVSRDGEAQSSGTLNMKAVKVGKDAVSGISNAN